jgi:hypothetical protein
VGSDPVENREIAAWFVHFVAWRWQWASYAAARLLLLRKDRRMAAGRTVAAGGRRISDGRLMGKIKGTTSGAIISDSRG